jgi:nucleoside-diphosphate-sugar epimerase
VQGQEAIAHLAGRAHVIRETGADSTDVFRRVNVAGTLMLARLAAAAGTRRFVYVSSIKVNGDEGMYTEADPPSPCGPYGASKLEAEIGLRELAARTGLEVVIVRPPLVYGPGVKANFRALSQAVAMGIPLPLGSAHNRRSLIALDNLVDFLVAVLTHPAAAGETFLVSDGNDLSTAELIRGLAHALRRSPRLVSVPPPLLLAVAAVLRRRDVTQRLLGSLQVDMSKARRLLGWTPPISVEEGLRRAVTPRTTR